MQFNQLSDIILIKNWFIENKRNLEKFCFKIIICTDNVVIFIHRTKIIITKHVILNVSVNQFGSKQIFQSNSTTLKNLISINKLTLKYFFSQQI